MEWQELSSSAIARIAYDEESRTLRVEFRNGRVYEYFDLPRNVYEELLTAPSAGRYVTYNIKDVYRYARAK
jgi:hypothetical protein